MFSLSLFSFFGAKVWKLEDKELGILKNYKKTANSLKYYMSQKYKSGSSPH
jgi:hypothetical protein